MNEITTNISLELLLLNDLLHERVIDDAIYTLALQKIVEETKKNTVPEIPVILATA